MWVQAKRSLALGDYISKLPQTDLAASPIASSAASEDGSVSQGEDGDVGRTVSVILDCLVRAEKDLLFDFDWWLDWLLKKRDECLD